MKRRELLFFLIALVVFLLLVWMSGRDAKMCILDELICIETMTATVEQFDA